MGYTTFDKAGYDAFKANDRDGPEQMLNLIKLREKASYADGRAATGAEAYAAYGRESAAVFAKLGGKIIWRGNMEQMLIRPDKHWDICFLAEYPSVEACIHAQVSGVPCGRGTPSGGGGGQPLDPDGTKRCGWQLRGVAAARHGLRLF